MHEELGRRIEDWEDLGELFVNSNHHDDNLHLFQARLGDRRLDIDLTELAEAGWFPRDALPADLGRFVRKILARAALARARNPDGSDPRGRRPGRGVGARGQRQLQRDALVPTNGGAQVAAAPRPTA